MSTDFILPDIGEGIVECELLEWLVSEGDVIEEDQPVAEVMTDKATVQIPAMHSGKVLKLYYQVGEIAKVHEPLFAMQVEGKSSNEQPAQDNEDASTSINSSAVEQSTSAHSEDFILPDIGEGIVECEIVKWLVAEGETVEEDQAVVEVMTDKAVVEIPAKHAGVMVKHYHKAGEIAQVHQPLFALSSSEHEAPATTTAPQPASKASATQGSPKRLSNTSGQREQGGQFEPVAISGKVLASPAVRRVAREKNVDLNGIEGSGKKGRILKQDVLAAGSADEQVSSKASDALSSAVSQRQNNTVKVKGIQAAMARQMSDSVSTIPHFTVSDELEMSALIALREDFKPMLADKGIKLSFMPFFIKALSLALNEFPVINSRLSADGSELTYLADHNIGLAVDSKIGLLVPNIKRVQEKSLEDIALELNGIIERARDGKLSNSDLTGGTISISNIGALGGTVATPVINKPEVAIVALGKTQRLPRFDSNDNVIAANIMTVNWSGDHRVIDGATMVKFNNLWLSYLQQPSKMMLAMR
ncbi:dihydrolipoyllysine-residue acetyltransferase [Alteromonas oceanisediminis]|uniref:dihydrolipoyllysine-residue acetyltransferase n=1 Tax=Alteromonas oceanisediminis TaxID=2836180 RepID=UPI001BD9F407|nr:dihydrolipoyllysine-residue acetyltransferase [Alteromonas oceanisediminis]MBT0587135.1 dihydrolipoyllysine-residue acetyltransferase [Alteromonas oceanisediminis]